MNDLELAWAAGFFEGEGSVGVNRLGGVAQPRLRLFIGQKNDRWPVDRFAAAVGLGNVNGPDKRGVYQWSVSGAKAHQAMELLLPHLGEQSKKSRRYREALVEGCVPEKLNGWATGARRSQPTP